MLSVPYLLYVPEVGETDQSASVNELYRAHGISTRNSLLNWVKE